MLGSMVVDYMESRQDIELSATVRSDHLAALGRAQLPGVTWHVVDFDGINDQAKLSNLGSFDWIINAIGITKPLIDESDFESVERATNVNIGLPIALARYSRDTKTHVLQIATDCVFSGLDGSYSESSPHDALDVYGKSKSMGETPSPFMHHLRCSIIGPEPKDRKFLIEWLLGQPKGAGVTGFTDHLWNGVTTLQFAEVASGIVTGGSDIPLLHHLVPLDSVNKATLLNIIATAHGRNDITVSDKATGNSNDRTLRSEHAEANTDLWARGGHDIPPKISEMVQDVSNYNLRLKFD